MTEVEGSMIRDIHHEMEREQSKRDCARERKRKQRDTVSEESEKESGRLRKKEEALYMYTGRVYR